MATSTSMMNLLSVIGILLGVLSQTIVSQNCGCGPNICCSRYGNCGTTNQSCAVGCQQGPCTATPPAAKNVSISDIVTPTFFNGIITSVADSACAGKDFYSRKAFLDAVKSYPQFAKGGIYQKQEVAAFFAHVTHETEQFCYIEEINGASMDYCDKTSTQYPCAPGKLYYGRGPLMLSWNYNYGPAGKSIGFDGLNKPETVAKDPVISFKTALWFWMNNVHSVIISGQGFGETIRAINGAIECNEGDPGRDFLRVDYYMTYCTQLGVPPGDNLRC
ncbi:hypothetical protein MKW94_022780 [Papaver nudicaule]|uniref:chitinase n=1 Tax=Papaver nudicaule TaxID=74823 RepID=A0AA41RZ95_PAPNU|nr:hypothetical protein [Papaver nudicaule]